MGAVMLTVRLWAREDGILWKYLSAKFDKEGEGIDFPEYLTTLAAIPNDYPLNHYREFCQQWPAALDCISSAELAQDTNEFRWETPNNEVVWEVTTGGPSWGDAPTESFDWVCAVTDLPDPVLRWLGVMSPTYIFQDSESAKANKTQT